MTDQRLTNFTIDRDKKEVTLMRLIDAPRELVFNVCNDPKLVPQWWGNRDRTLTVEKMDVKPGGEWRYIQKDASGKEYPFSGKYREIVPPERIVFTYKAPSGQEMLKAYFFEKKGDKTVLSDTRTFQTARDLDGTLHAGMEQGMRDSMERLSELVEKMKQSGNL